MMLTRIPIGTSRHITVDWQVTEFRPMRGEWLVTGRCRLWKSTRLRRGVSVASAALSVEVEIVTVGPTIQAAADELMRSACTQCLEGSNRDDTKH